MTEIKEAKLSLKVGDKLLAVYREHEYEVAVKKIGRAWAVVDCGGWYSDTRVSLNDLSIHSDDRFYGRLYLSKEHRAEREAAEALAKYLDRTWDIVRKDLSQHYRRPDFVDLKSITEIARILRIAIPPALSLKAGKE